MGPDDICKRFMSIRRVIYDVKKTEQSDFAEKQKNKKSKKNGSFLRKSAALRKWPSNHSTHLEGKVLKFFIN